VCERWAIRDDLAMLLQLGAIEPHHKIERVLLLSRTPTGLVFAETGAAALSSSSGLGPVRTH
jgi:hypothetical protein